MHHGFKLAMLKFALGFDEPLASIKSVFDDQRANDVARLVENRRLGLACRRLISVRSDLRHPFARGPCSWNNRPLRLLYDAMSGAVRVVRAALLCSLVSDPFGPVELRNESTAWRRRRASGCLESGKHR